MKNIIQVKSHHYLLGSPFFSLYHSIASPILVACFFNNFFPIKKIHDLPPSHYTPIVSTPTTTKCIPSDLVFEYFRRFRWVGNSAAALVRLYVCLSKLGAYVSLQVKSQIKHLPMLQGTIVAPSGLFPSLRIKPLGSKCAGMRH